MARQAYAPPRREGAFKGNGCTGGVAAVGRRVRPGEVRTKSSPLGLFIPIAARPEIASERCEAGHLEGDLICGAFNRAAIVTHFDRASRTAFLAGFHGRHDADAILEALQDILSRIPAGLRASLSRRPMP